MADGFMSEFRSDEKSRSHPIGVDVFDRDRRAFLKSWAEMLNDPALWNDLKREEVKGTFSMMRSLATLAGVAVDA